MSSPQTSSDVPGLDFLRYVLESIVEDKDALVIDSKIDELGVLLTVQVGDADMGKLIGKGGQTVKALRTLLRILGGNAQQRINLKILEPPSH
ncbi:MAG TPA: KH domain-containing protein [Candidatus Peribacteraceae bacterium]|nr:KH domain-containing protein [Candidatus Peribacteraceae bacterium]